jgi:hypothetical protein
MKKNKIVEIINKKAIEFMGKYGFQIVKEENDRSCIRCCFKNETTGLIFQYENRENYIFVTLCELVDGEIKLFGGEMRPDTQLFSYDLDDLLLAKKITENELIALRDLDLEKQLVKRVFYMEKFADDILKGDFHIFEKLDKLVKARAREFAYDKWGDKVSDYGWE